ncbi:MAG: hypothetical protein M1493_01720 [Firmicutes bacterium]|jgi:hypothetical protein|uniref:Uncharacterized protein n=1 Tax=Sulfobacillus benefaciens TaxID=453960 RepID=A0A2T2WV45_9FIRM|nr:hypothetical protein [Bacillota bacterium]PSR26096.1 MAG: hypothetical protein C7B43_14890 [Sulfobacillus benefaciens]
MVEVKSVDWNHEGWEIRLAISEGVYHLDSYPVRISHLAFDDDDSIHRDLATVVTLLIRQHLRQGSVPPHGMVLDWSRAVGVCHADSNETATACERLAGSRLPWIGGGVSNHF